MNLPFISAEAMKDYAVRTKVFILSVFLLAAILVVAVVGIYSNDQAKQSLDDMYHHNLMSTQYLNDANTRLRKISVNVPYILQENIPVDNRKILVDDVLGNLNALHHDMEELKKIDTSERAQATIAELEKNLSVATDKVGAVNNMGIWQCSRPTTCSRESSSLRRTTRAMTVQSIALPSSSSLRWGLVFLCRAALQITSPIRSLPPSDI